MTELERLLTEQLKRLSSLHEQQVKELLDAQLQLSEALEQPSKRVDAWITQSQS